MRRKVLHWITILYFFLDSIPQSYALRVSCRSQNDKINLQNDEQMTLGRKAESKCNLQTYSRHMSQIASDLQLEMYENINEFRNQIKLDIQLCKEIEEKYLPFGLEYLVPDSLKCKFDKIGK